MLRLTLLQREQVHETLATTLAGTSSDREALIRMLDLLRETLKFPMDVLMPDDEPCTMIGIEGRAPRRGLAAVCDSPERTEFSISLGDIRAPRIRGKAKIALAAYHAWLDQSGSDAPAASSATTAAATVEPGAPADFVVLTVKDRGGRVRLLGTNEEYSVKLAALYKLLPGHIATIEPKKVWRHGRTAYLSGELVHTRVDLSALGLTPLKLEPFGQWDPQEEYWAEPGEAVDPVFDQIIADGPRPMYEMEQIQFGGFDEDGPVLEALALRQQRGDAAASEHLMKHLAKDLRFIDGFAHLGNMHFERSPERALEYYELGVRIAELSLPTGFDGVLAWGLIDNRPFLRCLHGYGLCLWRTGRVTEAKAGFERMLRLNPSDNQGVRFLMAALVDGKQWSDLKD